MQNTSLDIHWISPSENAWKLWTYPNRFGGYPRQWLYSIWSSTLRSTLNSSTAQQRKPAALPNRHASMRNSREFDAWGKAFHFCLNLCILTANCKHRSIFPYSTSRTRFQMRLYFQIKVRTFTTPPNGKGFNWKLHKHVACGSKFWTSWEIRNPRLTLGVGRSGQILNNSHLPISPLEVTLMSDPHDQKQAQRDLKVWCFSCFWGNHTRWLLNLFRLPRSPGPYWRERWHNQRWPLSDPEWHGGNATTWF